MTLSSPQHEIGLTVEEALGLLDIMLVSPVELTCHQNQALEKLSAFCRQRLCSQDSGAAANPGRGARFYRLLRSLRKRDGSCPDIARQKPVREPPEKKS